MLSVDWFTGLVCSAWLLSAALLGSFRLRLAHLFYFLTLLIDSLYSCGSFMLQSI